MTRDDTMYHVERQLLHTAMLRPSSMYGVALASKHFANETHADLWGLIQALSDSSKPVDPVSVMDYAERMGMKSASNAAIEIAADTALFPTSNPAHYAQRIADGWRNRETRRVAAVLQAEAGQGSDGAAERAIAALMALHDEDRESEFSIRQALTAAMDQVQAAYNNGGALIGVPSGLSSLDEKTGGFHESDLIIIGARPAMGKTGFLGGASIAGTKKGPIGVVSAEQPHEQLGLRWLAGGASVSVGRLRAAKIEDEQWPRVENAVVDLRDLPIRIFDKAGADISEVIRVARRWKHQHGIKALYVDYLQRLRISAMTKAPKHERVGEIAASLKNLARDLKIPVIALAQVSRKVDDREGQRPCMGDLSDSSEIEKEADQIIMLWRDKTRPHADVVDAELIVEKNRHGNVGTVHCLWRGATTSFVDKVKGPDWMLEQ